MKLLVVMLALTSVAWADKHAPLPDAVLQAKTIYLENQSGYAYIADRAYDELMKWGRYKIVTSKKEADLILLFGSSEYQGPSTTTGTVVMNDSYGNNKPTTGTVVSNTTSSQEGVTHITVLDAKSGESLWRDSRQWGAYRSATRGLVKDLRKRVEEQEKQAHSK